jgi:Xaa-Pro aminopeptidase
MKPIFRSRIKKALALLAQSGSPETLILSANPTAIRSRDTHYPYRPNSDLFYLTGSSSEEISLVLRPHAKEPIVIIAPPTDQLKNLWEGAPPPVKPLARYLKAELLVTSDPLKAALNLVRGSATAYLQSIPGTLSAAVKSDLSNRGAHALRGLPSSLVEAEHLTATLRLIKDRSEIAAIRESASITAGAIANALPLIEPGVPEREIAAFLEYYYRAHGAYPAFNSIVATGPSAATLHYHALNRKLKKGDLLLIDTGAELNMYASDISRTIPVGGQLTPELQDLYEIVLRAQMIAIKRIRPGIAISEVHKAAAQELVYGLKYLGILKGPTKQLMKKSAFKPYFPHGIGHSLGIDVHDVSPANPITLKAGMVITIEPGLYFQKPTAHLPVCGVRIEDDVLVTPRGHEVLTDQAITKDITTLLSIMGG